MILSWVKSGLLFTVLATVILLLSPNKSYMKHISLVVGLLFILVMIHPVMEWFHLDNKTYAFYIENFLKLEGTQENLSKQHIELYEESVNIQLMAVFNENGYTVQSVEVVTDEEGTIKEVHVFFGDNVVGLEQIESYLKELFGQEVTLYYEVQ